MINPDVGVAIMMLRIAVTVAIIEREDLIVVLIYCVTTDDSSSM